MKNTNNQLKSWIFGKPILFSVASFLSVLVFILLYSLIGSIISIDLGNNSLIGLLLLILPFIYPAYYMIKKLPHDKIHRNDFIAIVNGCAFVSILLSLITAPYFLYLDYLHNKMEFVRATHPILFNTTAIFVIILALYLVGLTLSSIYAKYKRCTTMGVSPWKVILSMPFTFFMLWTPGYLIEEKTKKSDLQIKSTWYTKFHKWVLANIHNTLCVFLFIVLFRSAIAGIATIVLTVALLVIYTLWYKKHKSDFIQNINKGYALTAICLNIAIIISLLLQ